jgi:hypothetical protein
LGPRQASAIAIWLAVAFLTEVAERRSDHDSEVVSVVALPLVAAVRHGQDRGDADHLRQSVHAPHERRR